jgi:acetyltransferase-like isoleucine patch superfamily enzyme
MVSGFGGTTTRLSNRSELLTWAGAQAYVEAFVDSDLGACLTGEWARDAIPQGRSALLTDKDPTEVYYALFSDSVHSGGWTTIPAHRGQRTTVASTATIHDNVSIGDACVVMDNVVILPQSYIGDRVVIKPHTTLGGEGFQVGVIRGRRRLIPHAGGVVIGSDVTIGSSCCVDRGLFGEMSSIGDRTHVDNLSQVAHSDTIGRDTTITACVEISGSVSIGDGVWLAPRCAISHGLHVGDHAMVGIGSVVLRDVPPHAIVFGVPARVTGWRCACGARLTKVESELTRCTTCGRRFDFSGGEPILIDDGRAQASV